MNSLDDELERDIHDYIDNIDNMTINDKKEALRNVFRKHLHLNEADFILDKHNLYRIESQAKQNFLDLPTRVVIDKTLISHEKLNIVSIVQATIGELRRTKSLKKVVRFIFDSEY